MRLEGIILPSFRYRSVRQYEVGHLDNMMMRLVGIEPPSMAKELNSQGSLIYLLLDIGQSDNMSLVV